MPWKNRKNWPCLRVGAGKKGFNLIAGRKSGLPRFLALLMPLFFIRLGVKKMLAIGMIAWVVRYLLFAFGDAESNYWMLIGGIVLHGICYDFFFVTGQIYTDKLAGEKFKSAAQGFITLATYGVGMLFGSIISGIVVDKYVVEGGHDWYQIWIIPAAIAAVVVLLFMLFFRDNNKEVKPNNI